MSFKDQLGAIIDQNQRRSREKTKNCLEIRIFKPAYKAQVYHKFEDKSLE
jgi:hypothetical protein